LAGVGGDGVEGNGLSGGYGQAAHQRFRRLTLVVFDSGRKERCLLCQPSLSCTVVYQVIVNVLNIYRRDGMETIKRLTGIY
jgi:hypothetical protein